MGEIIVITILAFHAGQVVRAGSTCSGSVLAVSFPHLTGLPSIVHQRFWQSEPVHNRRFGFWLSRWFYTGRLVQAGDGSRHLPIWRFGSWRIDWLSVSSPPAPGLLQSYVGGLHQSYVPSDYF